ncbi:MAG: hypothetical protein ACFFGZ_19250 [Candidatus Thorarchaeota archaeon]
MISKKKRNDTSQLTSELPRSEGRGFLRVLLTPSRRGSFRFTIGCPLRSGIQLPDFWHEKLKLVTERKPHGLSQLFEKRKNFFLFETANDLWAAGLARLRLISVAD